MSSARSVKPKRRLLKKGKPQIQWAGFRQSGRGLASLLKGVRQEEKEWAT